MPRGITEQGIAVAAASTLRLGDRFRATNVDGSYASIANAGSGELNLGTYSDVGTIFATSSVALRNYAKVHGDVLTSGSISKQEGAFVRGVEGPNRANLSPAEQATWAVPNPGTSKGNVQLEPGATRKIAPGTWGTVSVKQNAKLTISTGTYVFDALDVLEPGTQLDAKTENGPITIYIKGSFTSRGKFSDSAGNGSRLLFVVLSQNWIALETPFRGTMVAPHGSIRLGSTWQESHRGAFFAREIDAVADAKITLVPFVAWPSLGVCTPLSTDERTKAVALGLNPDAIYPLKEIERHISLKVAAGARIRLELRYESGTGLKDTAGRFRVVSMSGTKVFGGSTYVVRH